MPRMTKPNENKEISKGDSQKVKSSKTFETPVEWDKPQGESEL